MQKRSTYLKGLRNLKDCSLSFSSSANFILGPNGAGKTALIEGIYLMSRGRSFRGGSVNALINNDSDSMSMGIKVETESGGSRALLGKKNREGRLLLSLDGLECKSFEDVGRLLPVQLILPNESDLVFFGPEIRRSFLDWGLFHVEQSYLALARDYRRTLKQRNAWLKEGVGSVDPWLNGLAVLGAEINALRGAYVEQLAFVLGDLIKVFSGVDVASLEYWGGGYGADSEEAVELLSEAEIKDKRAGATSLGPHRADMKIYVSGKPAKLYCSRGQAKLVSLCLAFSQADNLQSRRQINSILLIDDIGAELDRHNLLQSLELIKSMNMQAFITASNASFLPSNSQGFVEQSVFHVEHGDFIKGTSYGHR